MSSYVNVDRSVGFSQLSWKRDPLSGQRRHRRAGQRETRHASSLLWTGTQNTPSAGARKTHPRHCRSLPVLSLPELRMLRCASGLSTPVRSLSHLPQSVFHLRFSGTTLIKRICIPVFFFLFFYRTRGEERTRIINEHERERERERERRLVL